MSSIKLPTYNAFDFLAIVLIAVFVTAIFPFIVAIIIVAVFVFFYTPIKLFVITKFHQLRR